MTPDLFDSDGCTGFVDVWRGIDLHACCLAHDLAWFTHPGDWTVWLASNVELAICFWQVGVVEVAGPAFIAVTTIGAVLFAKWSREKMKRTRLRDGRSDRP